MKLYYQYSNRSSVAILQIIQTDESVDEFYVPYISKTSIVIDCKETSIVVNISRVYRRGVSACLNCGPSLILVSGAKILSC